MGKRERELFTYADGKLFWRKATSNRIRVGQEAGSLSVNNHRHTIRYDGRVRMLSRAIWDYHYGSCEGFLVDHKDRNPRNNRIENLRLSDYSQNAANATRHIDNTHGYKGVHQHGDGRYRAQIAHRGKRYHLGLFDTPEAAHAAYVKKASELYGEFHHGGV